MYCRRARELKPCGETVRQVRKAWINREVHKDTYSDTVRLD